MDGAVIGEIDLGSHILFAGGLPGMTLDRATRPLVWHDRRYNAVHPI